jgi:hypothetical protein
MTIGAPKSMNLLCPVSRDDRMVGSCLTAQVVDFGKHHVPLEL